MLAKIDSALTITEFENPENLADIGRYLNKCIKKIISVTETSSKVYKPKTYKQTISNLIHTRQ